MIYPYQLYGALSFVLFAHMNALRVRDEVHQQLCRESLGVEEQGVLQVRIWGHQQTSVVWD